MSLETHHPIVSPQSDGLHVPLMSEARRPDEVKAITDNHHCYDHKEGGAGYKGVGHKLGQGGGRN